MPKTSKSLQNSSKAKESLGSLTSPSTLPLEILAKKLSADAIVPTKEKRDIPDAGWDLYSVVNARVPGGGKLAVRTGIALAIPEGWFGNIRDRSGAAINTSLMVVAGVVDPGYRGEISVVFANNGDFPEDVTKGAKIAQILFEKIADVKLTEAIELPTSDRGVKGFGSTGV